MYNYIKGDYMNKKGFTLTELIVTIALIGIISMLAFPSIRKLKEDNSLEKYKTYEKVMENGAKLYVDSNKSDLFQYYHHKIITYDMLMDKKLIEEFEDKKVDCSESYVKAKKLDKQSITYTAFVICKHKQNGKEVYHTSGDSKDDAY